MADKEKKPAPKSLTQNEFFTALAESTGKNKNEVKEFYEKMIDLIIHELQKKGGGVLKLPNAFKITMKKRPAVKGGEKYINPFTKKEELTKPKPAKKYITVRVLKPLNSKLD